jgi:hypothetical protein
MPSDTPWSAMRSILKLMSLIKSIAGRKSAGVCGGGTGSGPSGRLMPTTGIIRSGRNARGHGRTARMADLSTEHPDYVEENRKRTKERKRDRRRRSEGEGRFAKMDSIMVKITLISED